MTITVVAPPYGPMASGSPPQDWDGYVFPPGCGGYGCPTGTPSVAGPPVTYSPSPVPSPTLSPTPSPAASMVATVGPSPTVGSLAKTGISDVFVTTTTIGSGMLVLGLVLLMSLRRRRRTG